MTRIDVHCPSQIIPADYEFVGQEVTKIEDLGDVFFVKQEREKIAAHMQRTGGTYSNHAHGGNCHICGSVNAVYTVLFYHAKTNTYIRTGQDCAQKLEISDYVLNQFRKGCQDALEAKAGKRKAQARLAELKLERCWDIYLIPGQLPKEESIIRDVVGKLITYGFLTDRQTEFLGKLLGQIDTRVERRQADEDAMALAADCPVGRVEITGTVLATKVQDSDYGRVTKMLVQSDTGFKVWGTCPSGFQKGNKVRFTATVTPSGNDPKFGFFKRPAKDVILESAAM